MRNYYSLTIHSVHDQAITPLSVKIHRHFNQLDKIELTALCYKSSKVSRLLFNRFEGVISGQIEKKIWGVITSCQVYSNADSRDIMRLTIEPESFKLDRDIKYRMYLNKNVADIIRLILDENNIPFKIYLNEASLVKKNQTQYQESSLNFIQRLCAENGFVFYIENTTKQQYIVIKDKLSPCQIVESQIKLGHSVISEVSNHKIWSNQIESHRYRHDNPLNPLHTITERIFAHRSPILCQYHYPDNSDTHREAEIKSYIKRNQLKSKRIKTHL